MARPRPVLGGGSPPSGAGRREEEQFTELRLHQHLKATLRPPQSHTKAIPKPPQSQTKATPKPTTQAISKAGGRGNRLFSQGLGHNENCCSNAGPAAQSQPLWRGLKRLARIGPSAANRMVHCRGR